MSSHDKGGRQRSASHPHRRTLFLEKLEQRNLLAVDPPAAHLLMYGEYLVAADPIPEALYESAVEVRGDSSSMAVSESKAWSKTATNGDLTADRDTRRVLTISIVPDGAATPAPGRPDESSQLIAALDERFGTADGGVQNRPWFPAVKSAFDSWAKIIGVDFEFEPNDDGARLVTSPGLAGVRGDIRLAGRGVDGPRGVLAYTYLPDFGDIVLDINDIARPDLDTLTSILAHEVGHAIGLSHSYLVGANQTIMGPVLIPDAVQPRSYDTYRGQQLYGDPFEPNDMAHLATPLGELANGATVVSAVSVDSEFDVDAFKFTAPPGSTVSITATPVGETFRLQEESGILSLDTRRQADLTVVFFAMRDGGADTIGYANDTGVGEVEQVSGVTIDSTDEYFVQITGVGDTQLYELRIDVAVNPTPPPGVIHVTTTADVVDPEDGETSLREAVTLANRWPTRQTIVLPGGTYRLESSDGLDDGGGLDITGDMRIVGASRDATIIAASSSDRAFDVLRGGRLGLTSLSVQGGAVAENGGVARVFGQLDAVDVRLTGGLANAGGGLAVESGGEATLVSSQVYANTAFGFPGGGGVYVEGSLVLRQSAVVGNASTGHSGGGISGWMGYELLVDRSTVANNTAHDYGGGVITHTAGSARFYSSTISGNESERPGGGMFVNGDVLIVHGTIVGNRSTSSLYGAGGGVAVNTGAPRVQNTILAGNEGVNGAPDVLGVYDSLGGNLVGQLSPALVDDGTGQRVQVSAFGFRDDDQVGSQTAVLSPGLRALVDDGAGNLVHLPEAGSPVIDSGVIDSLAQADQRNNPRSMDGDGDGSSRPDIGAVEFVLGVTIPDPSSPIPAGAIPMEAEDSASDIPTMTRSDASGQLDRWLHADEHLVLSFAAPVAGSYAFGVRLSNDNYGPLESIEILVDGTHFGAIEAPDTGDFGFGWNVFTTLEFEGSRWLDESVHVIEFVVVGGDGYGVELDLAYARLLAEWPTVSLVTGEVFEGYSGTNPNELELVLSAAVSSPVAFEVQSRPGTATDDDFVPIHAYITFAPGQTRTSLTLRTIGDMRDEGEEQLTLVLTDQQLGVRSEHVVTIVEDPPATFGPGVVSAEPLPIDPLTVLIVLHGVGLGNVTGVGFPLLPPEVAAPGDGGDPATPVAPSNQSSEQVEITVPSGWASVNSPMEVHSSDDLLLVAPGQLELGEEGVERSSQYGLARVAAGPVATLTTDDRIVYVAYGGRVIIPEGDGVRVYAEEGAMVTVLAGVPLVFHESGAVLQVPASAIVTERYRVGLSLIDDFAIEAAGDTVDPPPGGDEPAAGEVDPLAPEALLDTYSPLDVNRDGFVTPLDVLLIVNALNDPTTMSSPSALDANQDSYVTPLDALVIINELNRATATARPEGESPAELDEPLAASLADVFADDEFLQSLALGNRLETGVASL